MKLAIIGSKTFKDYNLLCTTLAEYKDKVTCVISGGAKGADTLAERWANSMGIDRVIYYPDWNKHGKGAGYRRNHDIVYNADKVIAFWDGKSKGTQHSIKLCEQYNKPVKVVIFN